MSWSKWMPAGGFPALSGSRLWFCVFINVQHDGKALHFLAFRAKASAGIYLSQLHWSQWYLKLWHNINLLNQTYRPVRHPGGNSINSRRPKEYAESSARGFSFDMWGWESSQEILHVLSKQSAVHPCIPSAVTTERYHQKTSFPCFWHLLCQEKLMKALKAEVWCKFPYIYLCNFPWSYEDCIWNEEWK